MLQLKLSGALIVAASFFLAATPPVTPRDEIEDLVSQIKKEGDSADSQLVLDLAGIRSREAMEALIGLYDQLGSIWMRREVTRALALFDGIPDAEEPALERLMNIATDAKELELREAALTSLGGCRKLGRHYLQLIVDSPAEDSIRETALEYHIGLSSEEDHAWYREIFDKPTTEKEETKKKKKDRKKKDDDEEPEIKVHWLSELRLQAFQQIANKMEADEILKATKDGAWEVRAEALRELHRRDHPDTENLVTEIYENIDGRVEVRIAAVKILYELLGEKANPEFLERGKKFVTPIQLRNALADLLAKSENEKFQSKLIREVGKGKPYAKYFTLRATRNFESKKLDKAHAKLLKDRDPDTVIATCAVLSEREDKKPIPDLMKLVEKSKEGKVVKAMLMCLTDLHDGDEAWEDKLIEMGTGEDADLASMAIRELGRAGGDKHLDLILGMLDSEIWSTRRAAVDALEAMRSPAVLGPIVERMQSETGRMLHLFADAMWRMTGKPFDLNTGAWRGWWENEGEGFELITAAELKKRAAEQEERLLRRSTMAKSEFFGIRIISHRVIFIVDVSGSMSETLRGETVGARGAPRMGVAKAQLKQCIDNLEPDALFNIIVFASDVNHWVDGGVSGSSGRNRDEAKDYVDRLLEFGGTNLYDAVEQAFLDPDVDTIFILSDGEPSAGQETDPVAIREDVARWNEHRGIEINTIAIGGQLQILAWLAEDSGGSHIKFR